MRRERFRATRHVCACGVSSLLAAFVASTAARSELLLAAAVSLREPLVEISQRFRQEQPDSELRMSFGASSALAAQARFGAPIDVLVSADERIIDDLASRGLVAPGSRFELARNRLVVLRSAEASFEIADPNDLVQPAVRRFAVAAPLVPVGRYAREWLIARDLLEPLGARIALTEHARATLAAVDLGHADLAIVYATDARLARSARIAWRIPDREQPRIVYTVARIARPTADAAGVEAFLAFLRSPFARTVLAEAGFELERL